MLCASAASRSFAEVDGQWFSRRDAETQSQQGGRGTWRRFKIQYNSVKIG
jgi:hypothetical protein